jgi:ribonuclease PH
MVAVALAVGKLMQSGKLTTSPLDQWVAAVSVGVISGTPTLDLCYEEDVNAEVDANVAMTEAGNFVEVQGTGEHGVFDRKQLDILLDLAAAGIKELIQKQKAAVGADVLALLGKK